MIYSINPPSICWHWDPPGVLVESWCSLKEPGELCFQQEPPNLWSPEWLGNWYKVVVAEEEAFLILTKLSSGEARRNLHIRGKQMRICFLASSRALSLTWTLVINYHIARACHQSLLQGVFSASRHLGLDYWINWEKATLTGENASPWDPGYYRFQSRSLLL